MDRKKIAQQKKAPFFKCRLCGNLVKVTVWRKHLVIKHNIGELIKYREYYQDETRQNCKCRICSKLINKDEWRGHLCKSHRIGKKLKFRDYYISPNQSIQDANKEWYNHDKKTSTPIEKDWHCGDIINGAPKVSVIFNALCTNRRKH